jgi:cbb3-type cytochrome oxidase maturation protein
MNEATIALLIMSVLIFLILLGFLIWGIKSGQFKKVEEAKYQIFKAPADQEKDDRPGQPGGDQP